jgi:hypothetical protein
MDKLLHSVMLIIFKQKVGLKWPNLIFLHLIIVHVIITINLYINLEV